MIKRIRGERIEQFYARNLKLGYTKGTMSFTEVFIWVYISDLFAPTHKKMNERIK